MAYNIILDSALPKDQSVEDMPTELALFGAPPVFAEPLYVGRPNIGSRRALAERLDSVLDSRWLTNRGPFVKEFERRLCELTGARHAIATCNATVALEVAIRALGLSGEVIVPSFTFVATAHALQWLGVTPVFCDIDPDTHCIDPRCIERLITAKTTGIIGVHVWGRPCCVENLRELADRNGLALVFDAAHAFGCSHNGRMIGNFGDCEVFSFHATKFVNSLEGGAVVTNNSRLADRVRLMHNSGFSGFDNVVCEGTNGKMNEISAAMGVTSLEAMDQFIALNRSHYHAYREELAHISGVTIVEYDETEKCNYQYVVMQLDETLTGLNRDALVRVLHAENIIARRYFYPGCHRMHPYQTMYPDAGRQLPHTERLSERVISLPTGTGVTREDISKICGVVRYAIRHAKSVMQLIGGKERAVSL